MSKKTLIVNNVALTNMVERDSYETTYTPIYTETITTMDGVEHTALLRHKGSVSFTLNPQSAADTKNICTALANTPMQVQYFCLQRNQLVTATMKTSGVSATFLSRCLYGGLSWNSLGSITLEEL